MIALHKCVSWFELFLRWVMWPMGLMFNLRLYRWTNFVIFILNLEFVRKGLLNNFNNVMDEMESNIFEDTFQLCGLKTNSMEKIEGKSRKDRAFNFLMTVMLSDVYVLAFKKALIARELGYLMEMHEEVQDIPMEDSNTGRFIYIKKFHWYE